MSEESSKPYRVTDDGQLQLLATREDKAVCNPCEQAGGKPQ